MNNYAHILAAIDLTDESQQVFDRAVALSKVYQSRVSLIHVVEVLSKAYGSDLPLDLNEVHQHLDQRAQELLSDMVRRSDIEVEGIHVFAGRPITEIRRFAAEQ